MEYIIKVPQLSKSGLRIYYSKLEVFERNKETLEIRRWIIKNGEPVLIDKNDNIIYLPRDLVFHTYNILKENYKTERYWTKYGHDKIVVFETMEEAVYFKKELLKELKKIIIEKQNEFNKIIQNLDNIIKG